MLTSQVFRQKLHDQALEIESLPVFSESTHSQLHWEQHQADKQQAFPIVSFYHSKCSWVKVTAEAHTKLLEPKGIQSQRNSKGTKSLTLSQGPLASITEIAWVQRAL